MSAALKTSPPAMDSVPQRIAWLNRVSLFSGVAATTGALEELAGLMDLRHYPRGAAILSEGDEGSDAFFLCSGSVRVLKSISGDESFPVAVLAATDHPFFGEAALLQRDKRSATILTETDCVCLVLSRDAFDRFCAERAPWALPIVLCIARVILDRLHKTNDDVVLLYNALVREVKGHT